MNKDLMRSLGFNKEVDSVENGACPFCGSKKLERKDFKDELSWKDYLITGLCQDCQDITYKEPNESI